MLRFSFICAKCEAIYCENCVKAIINMENACWACNEPLDESKPYKPYKKLKKKYVDLIKNEIQLNE